MGQWDDKVEKAAKKWDSWNMQEYSQHDRVLPKIIEDKARQFPDHVVFQFRDAVIALRKCEGIDKQQFPQRFGFSVQELAGDAIIRYLQTGLLEETETHLRLTTEGRFLADTVIVDFL